MVRKPENVQLGDNEKNCCQATATTAEDIFVQLYLSGMVIMGTRHVNSGFSYVPPLCCDVRVCGGRVR